MDFSSFVTTVETLVRVCLNGTGGGGDVLVLLGIPLIFPGEFKLFPGELKLFPVHGGLLSTEADLGLPLGELVNPVLSTELDLLWCCLANFNIFHEV